MSDPNEEEAEQEEISTDEQEVTEEISDSDSDSDSADSEDGDSDDLDETDESGEKSTGAGKDEEIDWKARAEETSKRLADVEAKRTEAENMASKALSVKQREDYEKEEKEKVLHMTPEERIEYRAQQAEQRIEYVNRMAEFRIWDANDRADFIEQQSKNPIMKKYSDEVEKRVEICKKAGHPYTRKDIAIRVAGERVMASAGKGGSKKQKQQAQTNVDKSRASATKGSGGVKANGRADPNSREARNERLRSTTFT